MGGANVRSSGIVAIVTGCLVAWAPPAFADSSCNAVLGGEWLEANGVCATEVTSIRQAIMTLSVGIPRELIDDPTAGPVLREYMRTRIDDWRTTGATMVRANEASTQPTVYSHGSVRSVVFHEYWWTVGNMQNNAYRTFTFDLASGRQLGLADLFASHVDPLSALPPLVRPYLVPALDAAEPPHSPGTYPFTTQEWEPQLDGSGYSGEYRAFALTDNELILYMPDAPMAHENPWPQDRLVWSMDGGTVIVRVPLTALAPVLRPL
jgi:Protein of unknown function (DUF3298)